MERIWVRGFYSVLFVYALFGIYGDRIVVFRVVKLNINYRSGFNYIFFLVGL